MTNTATVTGYTANGKLVTALLLENVSSFLINNRDSVIRITYGQPDVTFTLAYVPETMNITVTTEATGTVYLVE